MATYTEFSYYKNNKHELNEITSKIYRSKDFPISKVYTWWCDRKHIVFTNGVFDLLHKGHLEYLYKAKQLGEILIVGLNSDESVKKIKGPDRPINDERTRAMILASLIFVDAVILFDEETPLNLIKLISPDILVKGKDYKEEDIVGYSHVKQKKGKVITIELTEGYSTTKIIDKINALQETRRQN